MLEGLTKTIKDKLTLSDKRLEQATWLAKWAKRYSTSGVWFWGGAVALGSAALGLQAVGVPVPATIGFTTIVTGAVMTAKSVLLEKAFAALQEKGEKETRERMIEKGITPPELPPKLASVPSARFSFNPKAAIERIKVALQPKPPAPRPFLP